MAIKDSGSRTEFESGAVRDIQKGKGRCDLLPLETVARIYWDNKDYTSLVFSYLSDFVLSGNEKLLLDVLKAFCKVSGWTMETLLLEASIHFEEGAEKYSPDNWKKGIPARNYINSGVRHFLKYLRGDDDERHDRAFVWNIICCWWTCEKKPGLNDYMTASS